MNGFHKIWNFSIRAGCLMWGFLFILFTGTLLLVYLAVSLYLHINLPVRLRSEAHGSGLGTAVKTPGGNIGFASPTATPAGGAAQPESFITPAPSPTMVLPTPDPWNGKERVNILVLGLDAADWQSVERMGPPRSDMLMVLSIDPATKSAGILSIPRDLWVDIPGMVRPNKINTAHRFGELYRLPGGGPGLAMRTVENLLGIPLHYFVRLDFRAFERFVDEIGGVEVDVPDEIKIDPTGPGNTVILKPGKQLLDGAKALAYARNRNTSGDDIDRSYRQQQVILAIRERALTLELLPQLISRAPQLSETLSAGIQTNLTLRRVIQLAWLAREIDAQNIRMGFIGPNEWIADQAQDGNSVYRPNPDRIRRLVADLFPASSASYSLKEGMLNEEARLSIIDLSGIPERAARFVQYLETQGFQVIQTAVGDERAETTYIIDYTGKPYTMRYLASLMGATPSQIRTEYTPGSKADIVIFLGTDWVYRKYN